MNPIRSISMVVLAIAILAPSSGRAQAVSSGAVGASAGARSVPRLVEYQGVVTDASGKPLAGNATVTFAVYARQDDGGSLWHETQRVEADKNGRYTVQLGSTLEGGVPAAVFESTQARWLGVQIENEPEGTRTLFVSVPYAFKAGDAETLGGLPMSAFALAGTGGGAQRAAAASGSTGSAKGSDAQAPYSGTVNHIAKFVTTTQLGNSGIFETGGGQVGIGTTTPGGAKLSVVSTSATGVAGNVVSTTGKVQGVLGTTASTGGIGVLGIASATSGGTVGVVGQVNSAAGAGGVFINNANGKILSGQHNGSEVFRVDPFGNVTAATSVAAPVVSASTGVTAGNQSSGVTALTLNTTSTGKLISGNTPGFEPFSVDGFGNAGANSLVTYGNVGAAFSTITAFTATGSGLDGTDSYGDNLPGSHNFGIDAEADYIGAYGFGNSYGVFSDGNFAATGTKSAVVLLADNRVASLYAVESPENWFEDFGTGKLTNGVAQLKLEPLFAQTVNASAGYHVFLTPRGDSRGLYVTNLTPSGFEVREQGGGTSNIEFDFRIVAKRKGYEALRLNPVTADEDTVARLREWAVARPAKTIRVKKRQTRPAPAVLP